LRSWPLPFQDDDLLAEREDFDSNIGPASEEGRHGGTSDMKKRIMGNGL
jgi:hypothetical protein